MELPNVDPYYGEINIQEKTPKLDQAMFGLKFQDFLYYPNEESYT